MGKNARKKLEDRCSIQLSYGRPSTSSRSATAPKKAGSYFAFLWAFGKQMCRRAGNTFEIDSHGGIRSLGS